MKRRKKKARKPCKRGGGGPVADKVRRQPVSGLCRKKAYRSKADAKLSLRVVQSRRRMQARAGIGPAADGKCEQAPYRCPDCGMWHLTSMPRLASAQLGRRRRGVVE